MVAVSATLLATDPCSVYIEGYKVHACMHVSIHECVYACTKGRLTGKRLEMTALLEYLNLLGLSG